MKTLQLRLAAAFAGALAVVIALALGVFETAREALDASGRVAHTHEVLQALDGVEAAVARAESDVGGFVITGDRGYLGDRDVALSAIESRGEHLRDLVADNESQRRRGSVLRDRLDARLALLDRVALLRQSAGTGAARRLLQASPPRAATRAIGEVLDEMRQEERRLLEARTRREERRAAFAVAAGLALAAAFVLLSTLAYLAIRRRVRETLEARRRLEDEAASRTTLLESAPDGVVVADAAGRIVLVNAQTERLFGYGREELVGRPIETLVPESLRERHAVHRAGYAGAPRVREMGAGLDLHGRRKDGSRFSVEISLSPVRTSQGLLVFSNVRDATERKKTERTLRELNAGLIERTREAEAANRELESFSYSVSHDLRAPLRAIDGFSRMVVEDYAGKLDAEGSRRLDVIRDNARKMAQLIDDLLHFSRLGKKPLAFSTVDMTALAGEVYRELRAADAHGAPVFDLAQLPPGWGDRAMLRQVLANLLSNALKYAHKDRPQRIEVKGWPDGDGNVYCVKDHGVGFDMAYYGKLFRVFQRLHAESEFSGTGVGLAIVQRVVTRHGGRVWAESKPGQGSSFYFSLPRDAAAPQAKEEST